MSSVTKTFEAALRSVGTATTLALSGFYLHRRKLVEAKDKKVLAKLTQQVLIPALFFSKIVYCPQTWTSERCPNVVDHLSDAWILVLWPIYVVGCGLLVGRLAVHLSGTPPWQRQMVMASCAFANSTGLPITLLSVLQANFPPDSDRVDPNLFLSVYLLLYPVLQWSIGGILLSPSEEVVERRTSEVHHVLNMEEILVEEEHPPEMPSLETYQDQNELELVVDDVSPMQRSSSREEQMHMLASPMLPEPSSPRTRRSSSRSSGISLPLRSSNRRTSSKSSQHRRISEVSGMSTSVEDVAPLSDTCRRILSKSLQPPVVGALLGLLVAAIPELRGIFVDIKGRDGDAKLEWFFDALYAMGQAAVPVNMAILGINLSIASQQSAAEEVVSKRTIFAIVAAKMVVMPLIGILSTFLLKAILWDIPDDMYASFYLVLMIVTITPTANNVMVMVELSGSSTKEGMAKAIGWQYAVAPLLLSFTVMLVVRVSEL